jgi:hypothetical protein
MTNVERLSLIGLLAVIFVVGCLGIGFWESTAAIGGATLAAYCLR